MNRAELNAMKARAARNARLNAIADRRAEEIKAAVRAGEVGSCSWRPRICAC